MNRKEFNNYLDSLPSRLSESGVRKIIQLQESMEPQIDLSPLKGMIHDIEDELEKVPNKEAVLSTMALVAATPGIVKAVAKAAKAMMTKYEKLVKYNGFVITKNDGATVNTPKLDYIISVGEKIDSYLNTPFDLMLKPFVQDPNKRKKAAGILKALTLISMSASAGIDIAESPELERLVVALGGESLEGAIHSSAGIITNIKKFFRDL